MKKRGLIVGLTVLGFVIVAGGFVGWRVVTHNEGTVVPGVLYRSAQLDPQELAKVVAEKGIKTVINLRGLNARSGWYIDEMKACQALGVQHVDVRWSAQKLPPPEEVAKLLMAYREMPRPILLHCRSGSDRTGLACSIFMIDQEHRSEKDASGRLNWTYGHFAIYPYFEMDEFLDLYSESHGKTLADWVAQDYPGVYVEEMKESKMEEIIEPFEYAFSKSP